MLKYHFLLIVSLFFHLLSFSQNNELTIFDIPETLKQNANSIIRNQEILVQIKSISDMVINTRKVITVLNENGLRNIDAAENYNKTLSVNSIEAIIYNSFGKEIKKIKKKDFLDNSVAGDAADISDTRVLSLDYTPTEYPFTIVYQSEIQTSNTAFIPKWFPVDDFNESVQKSEYKISFLKDLGFKWKQVNLDSLNILQKEEEGELSLKVENLLAQKYEDLTSKRFGYTLFGTDVFSLEGAQGHAKSWKEFGLWMNEELLKNSTELPEPTKKKIRDLTANTTDPIEKARIVYDYVQNKTRYVSIQLGIGGWKPMLAKDVDRLGYGDCKALSNYTKALLEVVGVPSYYTIIYGGYKKDIEPDFVSMQGNHVVLAIPNNDKLTFLECTSQTQAFGFEGDFTDDRYALIVKPEGGEIVRTSGYFENVNSQLSNGKVKINEEGMVQFDIEIKYKGIQYEYANKIEKLIPEKIKEKIKERYSNIANLKIDDYKLNNDKKNVEFTERLQFSSGEVLKSVGIDRILNINLLNINQNIPQRYRVRKTNFEIQNGFVDKDEVVFEIDKKYKIAFIPEKIKLESKYGVYEAEIIVNSENVLKYRRTLLIKKGEYKADEYEEFRKFREQIAKNDNLKIILN